MRGTSRLGVYQTPAAWAGLALLVVALAASGARAESPAFTAEPAMSRGPVDAPVTIVEFSDYQ